MFFDQKKSFIAMCIYFKNVTRKVRHHPRKAAEMRPRKV